MEEEGLPASESTRRVDVRLGVVTPLANEEATVVEFLRRALSQLGPSDALYCVLDNSSRDNTRRLVEEAAIADPRVHLVWSPENRSVVDAYFRGYREALDGECDWILEMDGGLSHLPEEIPLFVAAMEDGFDFVAGSRFTRGGSHRGSLVRYCISRGGSVLANLMLGTRMRDMTSGFECFTRPALQGVIAIGVESRAHFFQTEIRTILRKSKWVEVPISYSSPSSSLTSGNVREAFRNLRRLRTKVREGLL